MIGWEDVILGVKGGHAKNIISHKPTLRCLSYSGPIAVAGEVGGGVGMAGGRTSDSNRPYLGHISRVLTSNQHNLPECQIKRQCSVCVSEDNFPKEGR